MPGLLLTIGIVGFVWGLLDWLQFDRGKALMVFGALVTAVAGVDLAT